MSDKELEEYINKIEPNFDSHLEKGTIEMSNEYYNLLEEKMARLINKNQSLKKQLEENQNPLKGIFAQVNDDTLLRDCGNMNAEINELKNQQKEFIEYLENEIKERKIQILGYHPTTQLLIEQIIETEKMVLSKYKEIIGG